MISIEEAKQLVSGSTRYTHMLKVSSLMGKITKQLDFDPLTWILVGLLHDLDYDETKNNRDKHGLIAAKKLGGKLSNAGLDAIRRHDHRTGLAPETDLDFSLILCDAISIILEESGKKPPISFKDFKTLSDHVSVEKPWLKKLVFENPIFAKINLEFLLNSE